MSTAPEENCKHRVARLESTRGCKHQCPDFGATSIGSTGCAPDKIIVSSRISPKSSAPPGYHPNHRLLLDTTRIIGSSWISPQSSAPPGCHPNHRLLLDINFQIINSSIYDIIRVIGIMFLELEDMYGIRLSIFYTLYITISYLSTGSGATPIGSASRAPDKKMEASSTMKNKPEDINIKIFE